jgi:dTDP-4-amino-4,6-dideoxygalactose transaminase
MILFAKRASAILYNILVGRRGDRPFIIPANVCPVVPLTFLKAGRTYEFVDISRDSYCLDDEAVVDRVAKNPDGYSGILFLRTYGIAANPDPFFRRVKELSPDLLVIDDKCLCIPEMKNAKESAADVELFSTGYSKYVDLGWGGFAYVDEGFAYEPHPAGYDKRALHAVNVRVEAALRARRAFEYQDCDWLDLSTPEMTVEEYFGKIKSELPTVRQQKDGTNAIYRCNLPRETESVDDGHIWRYNILVREKDRLLARIFAAGLFASSHYASLGGVLGEGWFDNAEGLHGRVVNLFNDFRFSEEKALEVCHIVRNHVQVWPSRGRP